MLGTGNGFLSEFVFSRQSVASELIAKISFGQISRWCNQLETRYGRNAGLLISLRALPTLQTLRQNDAIRII